MNIVYTHKGKPESSDLTEWIGWAESLDDDCSNENSSDFGNQGGQYDFPLVSIEYVKELIQQIRDMKIDTYQFIDLLNNPIKDIENKNEGLKEV